MNKQAIPIFIPDDEAKKYILFQEHYGIFMLLLENKVFEQKNASVTLHFDYLGSLAEIERKDFLYSKRFKQK